MVLRPGSRREAQVDRRREALLGRAEALRVAGQKRHAAAKEQQQQEKQAKAKEKLKAKREAVCAAVKPVLKKLDSTETATEEEALKKLSVPELKAYIQYQSGLRTFKSGEKKGDLVAMALPFWGEEPKILESSSSEEEDDGASPGGTRKAQRNKNMPATRRARGKSDRVLQNSNCVEIQHHYVYGKGYGGIPASWTGCTRHCTSLSTRR